jgi:hypothetical protein
VETEKHDFARIFNIRLEEAEDILHREQRALSKHSGADQL